MGNKIGHARKLEPPADDASASGLRDALDLSIADPADRQILDEQAVQEILESSPYPLLDLSIGDGRDDTDKVDPSRTDVSDHDTLTNETDSAGKDAGDNDATSRIEAIRAATAMLEELIEGESPTVRHRIQVKAARVTWVRRLLNWFMSRFGAV